MEKRVHSKRGLSTIVATLIIILLVFVAIGIFWAVVSNVIEEGSEEVSLGKLTLNLDVQNIQLVNDSALLVKVKRGSGTGDFTGLMFIVSDASQTEAVTFRNVNMKELQETTFLVLLQRLNASQVTKIEIAPIFTLESGKEVVGDVKDEYNVKVISSAVVIPAECTTNQECDDGNVSTQDICDVNNECQNDLITSCIHGDNYCPLDADCTSLTDNDCPAECGNGDVESGEQCDGSNVPNCQDMGFTGGTPNCYPSGSPNECTFDNSSCTTFTPTIFVTSQNSNGDFGGLSGADVVCQSSANSAGLNGNWMAWLSECLPETLSDCSDGTSASERLIHLNEPYILPNGVVVADNWADLTDGDLDNPINVDENGNTVPRFLVATGTNSSGGRIRGGNNGGDYGRFCHNWDPSSTSFSGQWLYAGYTDEYQDYRWTTQSPNGQGCFNQGCGGAVCTESLKLYCLRQ